MKQVENSVAEIGLPTQGIVEKTGGLVGVENIGAVPAPELVFYEGENETYIEASAENSGSTLYDKEIRDKPRTRHTKRNV